MTTTVLLALALVSQISDRDAQRVLDHRIESGLLASFRDEVSQVPSGLSERKWTSTKRLPNKSKTVKATLTHIYRDDPSLNAWEAGQETVGLMVKVRNRPSYLEVRIADLSQDDQDYIASVKAQLTDGPQTKHWSKLTSSWIRRPTWAKLGEEQPKAKPSKKGQ